MQERLYKKSLFVFRRDLRLKDNTALNNALAASDQVIACFIFDPQQVTKKNEFYSAHAAQFMIESLKSVNKQLRKHRTKLYLFYGDPEEVIQNIIVEQKIDAVFVNCDYTR